MPMVCRWAHPFCIGGGVKIIPPTMFSGNAAIPDLCYCFPRDTVKMVMLRFLPNLPIRPVIFCSAAATAARPLSPADWYGENVKPSLPL
jgi:hypothetical protein